MYTALFTAIGCALYALIGWTMHGLGAPDWAVFMLAIILIGLESKK